MRVDLKRWGSKITVRQSADIATRRRQISEKYNEHRSKALELIPETWLASRTSPGGAGTPETLPILLPSLLSELALRAEPVKSLAGSEVTLRRTACLKALHTVRSLAVSKAQLLWSKRAHSRSVANTTRSESYLQRLGERQKHAVWLYTNSQIHLLSISTDPTDARTFLAFKEKDLQDLNATVTSRSQLGEGYVRMPWYWRVSRARIEDNQNTVEIATSSVEKEYEDSKSEHDPVGRDNGIT